MQKGKGGRELCLATDRRNNQPFLARFLLKTYANSRLPTWFPNPKQHREQICQTGPSTCSSVSPAVNCDTAAMAEPFRPYWKTKKGRSTPIFSVFSTQAWQQPLHTTTNQNCIWSLLQRDVFGSEEGFQLTCQSAFESEDTHGLNINQ